MKLIIFVEDITQATAIVKVINASTELVVTFLCDSAALISSLVSQVTYIAYRMTRYDACSIVIRANSMDKQNSAVFLFFNK